MNKCDICLEETCKGLHNCNCDACNHKDKCYRNLHAIIRITTRCTQECGHCCFKCSPKGERFMSIETAKEIGTFLKSNDVQSINVMGGEFFLNKDWFEILKTLGECVNSIRLVTTGDWVHNKKECNKLKSLNVYLKDKLQIGVSKDQWHNNKSVDKAEKFLAENNFVYNIETEDEGQESGLVPIGRAENTFGFYSMFGCYCHNPRNMYSFLINEKGDIYKCGFGVWDYANVANYLDGGFRVKFKEFNSAFYKIFMVSCKSCIMAAGQNGALDLQQ